MEMFTVTAGRANMTPAATTCIGVYPTCCLHTLLVTDRLTRLDVKIAYQRNKSSNGIDG